MRFYAEESFSTLIFRSLAGLIAAMAEGIAFPYFVLSRKIFYGIKESYFVSKRRIRAANAVAEKLPAVIERRLREVKPAD